MELRPGLLLCFYPQLYLMSFQVCKAFLGYGFINRPNRDFKKPNRDFCVSLGCNGGSASVAHLSGGSVSR